MTIVADSNLASDIATVGAELEEIPEDLVWQRRAVKAWALRIQGYTLPDIAEELEVSRYAVTQDLKWAREHLPSATASIDEFVRVSIDRLDVQYRQLSGKRASGDVLAHRVSAQLIEAQAKLLGVYTINHNVNASVHYTVEGVDMGALT